jgi:hypothetical protein
MSYLSSRPTGSRVTARICLEGIRGLAEREKNSDRWFSEGRRLSSRVSGQDLSVAPPPESRKQRQSERFRSDVTELSPPFSEDFETFRQNRSRSEFPPRSVDPARARSTSVKIPRAPRLPQLELDTIEDLAPPADRAEFRTRQTERPEAGDRETIRTPPPEGHYSDVPPRSARSSERPHSERSAPQAAPLSSRSARLYFAPHLRIQARSWLESGSFSLPGVTSPRHSRALQRALLLSMLHEPGWGELPDGLKQRAALLFCEGWESSAAAAHPFREIDDLATVLGIACTKDARSQLAYSVTAHLPRNLPRRASSRPPPSR